MLTLRFASRLSAPADRVWAHATSPAGINRELAPLMKMTFPENVAQLDENTIVQGQAICTSWFLLLGVVPIDRARVTLVQIGPGHRFVEQSPLVSMRLWRHTREVTEREGGCVVEDVLEFEPRGTPPWLAEWTIRRIFQHRHARLQKLFGAQPNRAARTR